MYFRIDDKVIPPEFSQESFLSYNKDGSLNSSNTLNTNNILRAMEQHSNKISLPIMLGGFLLLSIILAIIFFLFGPSGKKTIYMLAGFGVGILISILIWFLWGKNNYKLI